MERKEKAKGERVLLPLVSCCLKARVRGNTSGSKFENECESKREECLRLRTLVVYVVLHGCRVPN